MSDVEVKFGGTTTELDAASRQAEADIEGVSNAAKRAKGGFDALNSTNRQVVKGFQLTGYQAQVLSYQMNDVFSGLLTGQKPFQVLMQQGPQITQIFGGLRGTLAAVAAAMSPVVIGIGLITGAVVAAGASVVMFERSQSKLERATHGAGSAAGATADMLDEYAVAAANAGEASTGAARDMVSSFAQTGKIGHEMFSDLISVSKDYAYAMGMDAKEATEDLGAAFADPVKGAEMLNDRMGILDDTTMQHIQNLVEQGRQLEAQQVLFGALQPAIEGAAGKAHGLAKAWDQVASAASNAWDWMGRAISRAGTLSAISVQQGRGNWAAGLINTLRPGGALAQYDAAVRRQEETDRAAAAAAQQRAEANRRSVAAGNAARNLLPKEASINRLQNQIQLLRRSAAEGGIEAATAQRAIAAAEREIADLQKPAGSGRNRRSGRSAEAAARREARERERAAQQALRVELATLDRQQEAVEANFEEWNRIQDQKIEAIRNHHGEESVEYQRAMEQKEEFARRFEQRRAREAEKAAEQARRIELQRLEMVARNNETIANADATLAQTQLDERRAMLDQEEAWGEVNAQEALNRRNQLSEDLISLEVATANRMYQIRLEALEAQLALDGLEADERARLNMEKEQLEVQHQQNLRVIRGQGEAQIRANNRAAAENTRSVWQGNISQMTGSFTSMFTQWGAGIDDFRSGWQNFGRSILGVIENVVGQMVERWVMGQLGMTTANIVGESSRTAAAATGTAARTGIQAAETTAAAAAEATETGAVIAGETAKTSATAAGAASRVAIEGTAAVTTAGITQSSVLMQIAARAASAAAGAYSAIAAIPVVGPFLAPAMAATALAGVLALGNRIFSAEGGWGKVPYDGATTELHKDEMVLPASIANPLRNSLSRMSPGQAGGLTAGASSAGAQARSDMLSKTLNPTFHYSPQVNAGGPRDSLDTILAKEGAAMRRWINNQVRAGKLKVV